MEEREWTWIFTYLMEHQKLDPVLADRILGRVLEQIKQRKQKREQNGI